VTRLDQLVLVEVGRLRWVGGPLHPAVRGDQGCERGGHRAPDTLRAAVAVDVLYHCAHAFPGGVGGHEGECCEGTRPRR